MTPTEERTLTEILRRFPGEQAIPYLEAFSQEVRKRPGYESYTPAYDVIGIGKPNSRGNVIQRFRRDVAKFDPSTRLIHNNYSSPSYTTNGQYNDSDAGITTEDTAYEQNNDEYSSNLPNMPDSLTFHSEPRNIEPTRWTIALGKGGISSDQDTIERHNRSFDSLYPKGNNETVPERSEQGNSEDSDTPDDTNATQEDTDQTPASNSATSLWHSLLSRFRRKGNNADPSRPSPPPTPPQRKRLQGSQEQLGRPQTSAPTDLASLYSSANSVQDSSTIVPSDSPYIQQESTPTAYPNIPQPKRKINSLRERASERLPIPLRPGNLYLNNPAFLDAVPDQRTDYKRFNDRSWESWARRNSDWFDAADYGARGLSSVAHGIASIPKAPQAIIGGLYQNLARPTVEAAQDAYSSVTPLIGDPLSLLRQQYLAIGGSNGLIPTVGNQAKSLLSSAGSSIGRLFNTPFYDPNDAGPYAELTDYMLKTEKAEALRKAALKLRRRTRLLKARKEREEKLKKHVASARYF